MTNTCQGRIDPRCHLVLGFDSYARRNTFIFPATDVCPHVAEYSGCPFDCALSGPFDELRSTGSQPPGSLYVHDIVLTSASQVFMDSIVLLYCMLLPNRPFVNCFFVTFFKHAEHPRKTRFPRRPAPYPSGRHPRAPRPPGADKQLCKKNGLCYTQHKPFFRYGGR